MRTLLKNLLLLAALSLATWTAVLGTWYAQHRVLNQDDALQYLVALPLLLFAGALVLRGWPRSAAPSPARPASAGDAQADTAPPATPGFPLLAAWVHTPAGADAPALLAAVAQGQPRPRPDGLLRDADGLPVLAARIPALDPAAVLADWPAQEEAPPPPAAQRALAALAPLLDQASETLAEAADDGTAPPLHVLAHWPAAWSDAETRTAATWLARRLAPLSPATLAPVPGDGAALLARGQALLEDLHRAGRGARVLLLACHSDLDDAAIERLGLESRTHAPPRRPRPPTPGEAAAALLLSTGTAAPAAASRAAASEAASPGAFETAADTAAGLPAPVRLRALCLQPGAAEASTAALAAAAPLQALLDEALRAAAMERAALASLCCDADQLAEAATAVYALAQAALPHLDPMDDLRLVGTCCGHTGAVAPLLALAAAWAQCQAQTQPGVALCVTEHGSRLAAVLGPA